MISHVVNNYLYETIQQDLLGASCFAIIIHAKSH